MNRLLWISAALGADAMDRPSKKSRNGAPPPITATAARPGHIRRGTAPSRTRPDAR